MNIPEQIINIIKCMYTNPTFQVSMDGKTSSWKQQYTGIRQGCPLSPYLFIIVMTVMFHDIHAENGTQTVRQLIIATEADEVAERRTRATAAVGVAKETVAVQSGR